ncbi:hypothetical protein [Methylibium sp.]|uniref:hypothetical protein n=1 Tax=Methylibium sp. TaxID=2067992 RepID=UPI003BA98771
MAFPQQIQSPPQYQAEVVVNENLETLGHQAVYGKNPLTTTALTWGYFGGRWGGFAVADGTLTLTNSATNYIVVAVATGVASVSTSNTNWNNSTDYARVYQLTTAGGVVTATQDHRAGPGGAHGYSAAGGGGGGVSSVAASGGVETTTGSPITGTGTIRGAVAVNTETGTTYTYVTGDRGGLVSHSNGGAIAGTLPQAGTTGFEANWYTFVQNVGAGTLTITPTTSTIDGAASLALTTGQGVMVVSDGTNYYTMRGRSSGGSSGTAGKHSIYIPASEMKPSATGGCAALATIASGADQPDITTLDFDATAAEHAQFSRVLPKRWNEGLIQYRVHWSHPSGASAYTVVWYLEAVAVSNDDPIATSFGSLEVITDVGGTANDMYVSVESGNVTVGGSPAAGDMVFFRITRDSPSGTDDLNVDARLHGITIFITTDAENDA